MTVIGLDGNLSWDTAGPAIASTAISRRIQLRPMRFMSSLLSDGEGRLPRSEPPRFRWVTTGYWIVMLSSLMSLP